MKHKASKKGDQRVTLRDLINSSPREDEEDEDCTPGLTNKYS